MIWWCLMMDDGWWGFGCCEWNLRRYEDMNGCNGILSVSSFIVGVNESLVVIACLLCYQLFSESLLLHVFFVISSSSLLHPHGFGKKLLEIRLGSFPQDITTRTRTSMLGNKEYVWPLAWISMPLYISEQSGRKKKRRFVGLYILWLFGGMLWHAAAVPTATHGNAR